MVFSWSPASPESSAGCFAFLCFALHNLISGRPLGGQVIQFIQVEKYSITLLLHPRRFRHISCLFTYPSTRPLLVCQSYKTNPPPVFPQGLLYIGKHTPRSPPGPLQAPSRILLVPCHPSWRGSKARSFQPIFRAGPGIGREAEPGHVGVFLTQRGISRQTSTILYPTILAYKSAISFVDIRKEFPQHGSKVRKAPPSFTSHMTRAH